MTLDEWNEKRRREILDSLRYPRANGLSCPKCGAAMNDTEPDGVLAMMPIKTPVECLQCGYKAFRLV